MLFLFKKALCFLAFLAVILMLGGTTSSNKVNHAFIFKYESSVTEINNDAISVGAFVSINQAANFNHLNQITINYILVALLVCFLVCAVNYQWFKPTISSPPWYFALRHCSRINISGWKASNLQYKAQLTYQH
tara:strand:+ start:150 stop:548 length:399 start_codon:yes stop_codon:yes gene_type:complete